MVESLSIESLCSGSGDSPSGTHCPSKGSIAVADCNKHLHSWIPDDSHCVAQEDATCRILKSGAWGCVFSTSPSYPKFMIKDSEEKDELKTSASTSLSSGSGATMGAGTIAGIAAAAVIVAAALVAIAHRAKKRSQEPVDSDFNINVDGETPRFNHEVLATPV